MSSATILRRIAHSLRKESRAGGSPKYLSLHNRILAAIEAGDWAPGEKLPPETAFAQEMPLSLGTIQKALQMLADDGVVVRRHRDGTYVAAAAIDEATIYRFLADDGARLLPIYINVRDVARTDDTGPWSKFLSRDSHFVRITRRVSVNLEFEAHSQVYLPESRYGDFLDVPAQELHGASLEHILGERYNTPVLRTVQRMQVTALPIDACRAIGIAENTVGMAWEVLAYSYRDLPITYQRIYLPPNGRRLEVREERR